MARMIHAMMTSLFLICLNVDNFVAKKVTDEELALNRQRILAENPDITKFLTSAEKSTSFLKNSRIRTRRSAETRSEVQFDENYTSLSSNPMRLF